MKRLLLALVAAGAAGALWMWITSPAAPRAVDFAKVRREDLVSTLVTNGRVEPQRFTAVRAARPGSVVRVMVERGQVVRAGDAIAEFDASEARQDLTVAEARLAQVEAERQVAARGASPTVLAEIRSGEEAAKLRLEAARRDLASLERLKAKGAVAEAELREPRDRIAQSESELRALADRRTALAVTPESLAGLDARIREARVAVDAAKQRITRAVITAPAAGSVYNAAIKAGAFVQPGDLVAEIGNVDRLRLVILIDEPELGRVSLGAPVKVTWSGLPDAAWQAAVERLPVQVAASGSRQVGEAWTTLANDGGKLPPGANVDVEIRTGVQQGALTIPRGAVRREELGTGAWALVGDKVEWRRLELGASSVTRIAVLNGLRDGDAVALASDPPLRAGDRVAPRFP